MRLSHIISLALTWAALFTNSAFSTSPGGADTAFVASRYSEAAHRIIARALSDSAAFERLAYMCDTFGPRLSGSKNLENALRWIEKTMKSDGLDNVHSEPVMVPHWVRGKESLLLLEPRHYNMLMLGLGG
ncbi:MAG: peptidase M28 family protein, partial [Chlorobi bacterium]|nr:peptidase M28 family protein [Chlorobiota bacterium]